MGEQKRKMRIGFKSTRVASSNCTGCGKELDGATSVFSKRKPRPGQVTICLYCGHMMAFNWELKLRELTDKEMIDVAGDKRILAIQQARGEAVKAKAEKEKKNGTSSNAS